MKTETVFIVGLIALLSSGVSVYSADPAQPAAEEHLTKIEHDWSESYVKRDASFAQRITLEDFAFVGPDGNVVNKSDYGKSIPGPAVFTRSTSRISGSAFMVTRRL